MENFCQDRNCWHAWEGEKMAGLWNKEEIIKDFQKSCPQFFVKHKLERFQFFYYPVSIAEVDVKEYIIEEYESVELLVLQLFDAGLTNAKDIHTLTGLDKLLITRIIDNERFVYGHIESGSNALTEMGKKTLEENSNSKGEQVIQHALYDVKREIQIEALTGTVIPYGCETNKKRLVFNVADGYSRILPRETVQIDAELTREIRERLDEYKHYDILNDGETIRDFGPIRTREVRYGRAFLAEFKGLIHPMIIIEGYRFDKEEGRRVKFYTPTALSASNARELKKDGVKLEEYLVRADKYFQYLMENKEKIRETDEGALENLEKSEAENRETGTENDKEMEAVINKLNTFKQGENS